MIKSSTHLHFNGTCYEAFKHYESSLDGKIAFSMKWGESPAAKEVSPEWSNKLIHARLEFDGGFFTGDDAPPGRFSKPQGMEVLLLFNDPAKAENVYKKLSKNASVIHMPFAKTFWSPGFGMFVDSFGVPWMLNCEPKQ